MANENHFKLTLDTLAPEGSITRAAQFMKANANMTIDKGDATFMYLWFDTKSTGDIADRPTTPVAAAGTYKTAFTTSGTYYYHLVLEDDLANRSIVYDTDAMIYDVLKPEVKSASINNGAEVTKSRDVTFKFTFEDNLSGCISYTLSGDLADSTTKTGTLTAAEIAAGAATRSVTLSGTGEEESTKTVKVTVTDNAGNTSDEGSDSIVLDTKFITGDIVLRDSGDTKNINETWVNSADLIIKLVLGETTGTDVTGYKVWGDINKDGGATATTEPASYTTVTTGTNPIVINTLKFTSGDSAAKYVKAKVIDDAGNETPLTSVFAKVDRSAPSASIALSSTTAGYVSLQSGFSTVTITPTVNAAISGLKSYTLNLDGNATSVTGTTLPATLSFEAKDMGDAGSHTFSLTIVDNAGNTTTSATQSIIKDTAAPVGTISMSGWANKSTFPSLGVTASATDDKSGMAYMTCWCSTVAKDTTVVGTQIAYAANPTHAQVDWTKHAESASNYIHIEYVDAVGNKSIAHSGAFGIDTVEPSAGTVGFDAAIYNNRSAAISLASSDDTSGMTDGTMKIWGDIVDGSGNKITSETAEYEAYAGTKSVTLTTGDGNKTIHALFKDVAGNVATAEASLMTGKYNPTVLDMTAPTATLSLLDTSGAAQPAITNQAEFKARITAYDDAGTEETGIVQYLMYGDFTYDAQGDQGITRDKAAWTTFTPDSGSVKYMTIGDMFCTTGDNTKNVYIYVKDDAGNVYPHKDGQPTVMADSGINANFEYDTTAPTVVVSAVDYNRISKIQELRRNASGLIKDKYNDQVHFTITPDSKIQAYQICAYATKAEAEAGDHTKGQVTADARCANISATGLNSDAAVNVTISGAAYESALVLEEGKTSKDGAHFVVAYVQDLGGTWSVAGEFEVLD